jgi:hypothetical protein
VQEDLFKVLPALLGVGSEHAAHEIRGGATRQVVLLVIGRVPGSEFAAEHYAIARIEKHLSGAARGAAVALGGTTECESNVANAVAGRGEPPRLSTGLVEQRRRQIPCEVRSWRQVASTRVRTRNGDR